MVRRIWHLCCLLCLSWIVGGKMAQAQIGHRSSVATIVYDVKVREFRCWSEGDLADEARTHPCDPAFGWHPVSGNLYFVRGQQISVLLKGATVEDLFSIDLKVDDLAEPTVPVSGALTELPKLLPIIPAPTVLAGVNAVFSSGLAPIKPSQAYRLLLASEEKDFKSWLQSTVLDSMGAKEVSDLLALDFDSALAAAGDNTQALAELQAISQQLDTVVDPQTMDDWIAAVSVLTRVIDKEASLRNRLSANGVPSAGKIINDALTASRSTALQRAMAIDPADFSAFASVVGTAFQQNPYGRINAIEASNGKFQLKDSYRENPGNPKEDMKNLLAALNSSLGGGDPAAVLNRLKTNLTTLADNNPSLQLAEQRRESLESIRSSLADQKASPNGIYELQKQLNKTAATTIVKAAMLNGAAKLLPLQKPYDLLSVGQWFGSKTITLTLKQGQRLPLFDIGGVSDSTRTSVTGGDAPAAKSTQISASDLGVARVIQFPIYNLYHWKVGMGFVYSTADDNRFQVSKVTTGSGSSATTQQFIDQTRMRDYNLLATANVMFFPWAQHAFPWRPRYTGEHPPGRYQNFAPMIGFSMTSPNRDFLLGGAWFPRLSPVGVQLGWHIALRDYPPKGVDITQPLTGRAITLQQRRLNGLAVGLVFTTDFFGKIFAPIFKP